MIKSLIKNFYSFENLDYDHIINRLITKGKYYEFASSGINLKNLKGLSNDTLYRIVEESKFPISVISTLSCVKNIDHNDIVIKLLIRTI